MLCSRSSICLVAMSLSLLAAPAGAEEPWKEPQDPSAAINTPDNYAWRLFVALNWPADIKQKKADPAKTIGDAAPGPVVWETWRNANNNAKDTAFPIDGSDPGPWLDKQTSEEKVVSEFDADAVQQAIRRAALKNANIPLPAFDEAAAQAARNETRLNKETYEFVRQKHLYNLDEQIKLFADGAKTIEFPVVAKEVKAQWREIDDTPAAKKRYHWAKGSDGKIYGLTALHITTKDLPNWFWATFEHIDNKTPESQGGRPGNIGWLLPSRDRVACSQAPHDCDKAPAGFGLEGTKWENYRLRGTQIDFTDSRGNATLLANSQPEKTFQVTSSCITCHARSTVGNAQRLTVFKCVDTTIGDIVGITGAPQPEWFAELNGKLKFSQLDFVWSLARARRSDKTRLEPPEEPPCQTP